jgi:hypothetical protein
MILPTLFRSAPLIFRPLAFIARPFIHPSIRNILPLPGSCPGVLYNIRRENEAMLNDITEVYGLNPTI